MAGRKKGVEKVAIPNTRILPITLKRIETATKPGESWGETIDRLIEIATKEENENT